MVNRRRYERVPFYCAVTLTAPPEAAEVAARTIDVSLGGVGLACPTAPAVGRVVTLTFHLGRGGGPTVAERVAGRVANVCCDPDVNRIGVEFAAPLDRAANPALVRAIEEL